MSHQSNAQLMQKAVELLRYKQVPAAKAQLLSVYQNHPFHTECLTHLLGIAYAKGDFASIAEYEGRLIDPQCKLVEPRLLEHLLLLLKNNHSIKTAMHLARRLSEESTFTTNLLHICVDIAIEARANDCALAWLIAQNSLVEQNAALRFLRAKILAMQGQFKQAVEEYRAVLALEPAHSGAIAGIAKSHKFDRSSAAIFAEMVDSHLAQMPDAQSKARVLFAKAKAMNDCGDYDDAWSCATKANQFKLENTRFDAQQFAHHVAAVTRIFTPEVVKQYQSANSTEHVFVVGMPRSGTTLVEQILSVVDGFYPGGETPAVENAMRRTGTTSSYLQSISTGNPVAIAEMATAYEQYFTQFANFNGTKIIDKVPTNFFHVGFIKLMFPNAKIINMTRDKRDVAVSIYFENFSPLFGYTNNIDDILAVEQGAHTLMTHWKQLFDGTILDVSYESLVSDYGAEIIRIGDFLGVDLPSPDTIRQSTNHVETPSIWQVRQPINTGAIGRWKHYEQHLNAFNLAQ